MYTVYNTYVKDVLVDCILTVRLPTNSRLLVVKFWGVKSYAGIFNYAGVGAPDPHLFMGQPYRDFSV